MMGEGGGKEGPGEEGRKEEERGKGGLQLRPHTPKASWSPEAPVALGLSLPAEVRQIGRTCRVAPLTMPQVSLVEATPRPRLASWVFLTRHPGPILCWVRTSGQGLESRRRPPSPWGCSAALGVGGGCRPAKLRRPRELGLGFRLEPSGIQAFGKGPLAISKKNAAGIFSASPKRQGPP